MSTDLKEALDQFASANKFKGKGTLSVALVMTRRAREDGLPLDPETQVTRGPRGGGQVRGLGPAAVRAILKEHGIERVLAAEGGRTSRGSINNMRKYVTFLNDLHRKGMADVDVIEAYWIDRASRLFR